MLKMSSPHLKTFKTVIACERHGSATLYILLYFKKCVGSVASMRVAQTLSKIEQFVEHVAFMLHGPKLPMHFGGRLKMLH